MLNSTWLLFLLFLLSLPSLPSLPTLPSLPSKGPPKAEREGVWADAYIPNYIYRYIIKAILARDAQKFKNAPIVGIYHSRAIELITDKTLVVMPLLVILKM